MLACMFQQVVALTHQLRGHGQGEIKGSSPSSKQMRHVRSPASPIAGELLALEPERSHSKRRAAEVLAEGARRPLREKLQALC